VDSGGPYAFCPTSANVLEATPKKTGFFQRIFSHLQQRGTSLQASPKTQSKRRATKQDLGETKGNGKTKQSSEPGKSKDMSIIPNLHLQHLSQQDYVKIVNFQSRTNLKLTSEHNILNAASST
jgi:hypothetical protein